MSKYIAFLRGINVSGKNIIKMDVLKVIFEELGFTAVSTYIQSGNIIFKSKINSKQEIENLIEQHIFTKLGMSIQTIVVSETEMTDYLSQCPFKEMDSGKLYFTFCKEASIIALEMPIVEGKDVFVKNGSIVYLYIPDGYGRTKLNNNFFEGKLKTTCTTRNLLTCEKIHAMLQQVV